jgi:DNA-binding SARP family transcriptional activator
VHGDEPAESRIEQHVFADHPYGMLVVDRDGAVVAQNAAARRLLGTLGPKLDTPHARIPQGLLSCQASRSGPRTMLLDGTLRGDGPLPETRIDLPEGSGVEAAWVTVSPLPATDGLVLVELRPGLRNDRRRRTEPFWAQGAQLRVSTLGRTRVESGEASIGGRWLANRTGQVLKYLVTARHRAVSVDEIAEHLWPQSGARSSQGVRYFIHALRERLEPERAPRAESYFVRSVHGGYTLDLSRVHIDADEFERAIGNGQTALDSSDPRAAVAWFTRASDLYGGDFLADEPYAEWAMAERDRLRTLAADALRALTALAHEHDDVDAAAAHLDRLAALEPYDVDVHRLLIGLCLRRGRRTEALRRYTLLRRRLLNTFGEDLDFTLADLATDEALPAVQAAPMAARRVP